jgi:hypothetical protein
MFVEFVEVEIAQLVVADSMRKHVVDGHQDLVGHATMALWFAKTSAEARNGQFWWKRCEYDYRLGKARRP